MVEMVFSITTGTWIPVKNRISEIRTATTGALSSSRKEKLPRESRVSVATPAVYSKTLKMIVEREAAKMASLP